MPRGRGAPADIDLAADGASVVVGNRAGSARAWVVRLGPDGALDRRFEGDGRLDFSAGAGTALCGGGSARSAGRWKPPDG